MIYDLKELMGHLDNTEWRNDSEKAESIALMLFGIAERLEALVEAQKRVEERYPHLTGTTAEINAKLKRAPDVVVFPTVESCALKAIDGIDRELDFINLYKPDEIEEYKEAAYNEIVSAFQPLAEVMAKLRGGQ